MSNEVFLFYMRVFIVTLSNKRKVKYKTRVEYRGRPGRLEPTLAFAERHKRGSRGAARAAKSLRWRV